MQGNLSERRYIRGLFGLDGVGEVFGAIVHGVEPVGVQRITVLGATGEKQQSPQGKPYQESFHFVPLSVSFTSIALIRPYLMSLA